MSRFCWPLVLVLCFGQAADYTVKPKFLKSPEIQRVLERVDAAADIWVGEKDFEAVDQKLRQIAARLLTDRNSFPPLSAVVSGFSRLSLVEFKIISSERAREEAKHTRLRVRVELGGHSQDGRLLSLLGHCETAWVRSGEDWVLESFRPGPFRTNSAATPFFTDITAQAIGHNRSFTDQLAKGVDYWRSVLDEATGIDIYGHNGIAVGDYDGDGLEDLYVCQPSGLPNRLYRNNGDGTFTDATYAAGLEVLDNSSMALFADLDNDGDQDLIVITSSQPLLFRNDGKGRFYFDPNSGLAVTARRGATLTGAAMADYDRDGYLDLYVCAYDFWKPGSTYAAPTPYYDATNGPPNVLFRNRGDGTFEDVTKKAGLMQNNNRFSFAAAWGDYNNDGYPDLYVVNDFGRKNLYRNNGDGTFTDVAAELGVEDMGAGMSVGWADYDNDGRLDLYTGNMWSSAGQRVTHNAQFRFVAAEEEIQKSFQRHARGNSLFHNNGKKGFADVTLEAGVEMGRWAWASDFVDINNDGREDLYLQNGYVTGEDARDL